MLQYNFCLVFISLFTLLQLLMAIFFLIQKGQMMINLFVYHRLAQSINHCQCWIVIVGLHVFLQFVDVLNLLVLWINVPLILISLSFYVQ